MFNKTTKAQKLYSITLKTSKGNTVAYINLSSQFTETMIGKQPEYITMADIQSLNKGDFETYIKSLILEVSETTPTTRLSPEDF